MQVDSLYDLSLIIACYNEEPILEESVRQIIETLDATRWTYELIFVDDCSQDRTREIIDQLIDCYRDRNLRRLFHTRNQGRGGTVSDGFRLARGDVAGYIDIDLEVHARYVPSMVSAVKNGADVATALRVYKIQMHLFIRWILSQGYVRLMRRMLQVHLRDTETGFKFFKRAKILPLLDQTIDQRWFWDTEIMARCYLKGLTIVEIPCLFVRRFDKRSTVHALPDSVDYFIKLWRFRQVLRQLRAVEKGG